MLAACSPARAGGQRRHRPERRDRRRGRPNRRGGAVADVATLGVCGEKGLSLDTFLRTHDAYPFFERTGGLLRTGLTARTSWTCESCSSAECAVFSAGASRDVKGTRRRCARRRFLPIDRISRMSAYTSRSRWKRPFHLLARVLHVMNQCSSGAEVRSHGGRIEKRHGADRNPRPGRSVVSGVGKRCGRTVPNRSPRDRPTLLFPRQFTRAFRREPSR